MQQTATHGNTLQHTHTPAQTPGASLTQLAIHCNPLQPTASHYNKLQHTHTHQPKRPSHHGRSTPRHQLRAPVGSVLQRVALCCSMLQCVPVYSSVLQFVAVYCSPPHSPAPTPCTYRYSALQRIATHCSTLPCTYRSSVLQCVSSKVSLATQFPRNHPKAHF